MIRSFGPLVVLALLVTMVGAVSPAVLAPQSLAAFITDASPLLLLVLASVLPILLGGIDLSVAAMATAATMGVALLAPHLGSWALPATLLIAAAIGCLQGWVIAVFQVPSFAISLGTLGMLSGFSMYLTSATPVPIDADLPLLPLLGETVRGIPNAVFVVLAVWILLIAAMRYLKLGRQVHSIGLQERAAVLSGVSAVRVRVVVYGLSAACAAMAGILYVSQTMFSSPTFADQMLLPAIVGVVLGGTAISGGVGGFVMSMVGGLTAAFLRIASVVLGLPPTSQDIVYGLVVLVAVGFTLDRAKLGLVK